MRLQASIATVYAGDRDSDGAERAPDSIPDFSPVARDYARARPRYPEELFDWLASLVARHTLAWDCATGSGQAARGLAGRFERVVATDVSSEQLRHAAPHPRIDYRVAPAEASELPDGAVDLVTVAAAAHWFDLAAFAREVTRVARPGGVLAAFTYHLAIVAPPFAGPFGRLYWEILKPHFARATELVDARYATLELPGTTIGAPGFEVVAEWTLEDALAFVRSWSGAEAYRVATGEDAAERIRPELEHFWSDPLRPIEARFPLFVRAQRL